MKALIVSDLQAHSWAGHPLNEEGVNLRVLDVVQELQRLRRLAIALRLTYIICLGDIFQERGKLDVTVLNSVYSAFKQFADSGITPILLVGNHDRSSIGGHHSLRVFESFAVVVDTPRRLKLASIETLAVPFLPDDADVLRALKLARSDTKLCCLHCPVKNVSLDQNFSYTGGVSVEDLPSLSTTVLGHYHRFHKLSKRAWYLGSLLPVDWSDVGCRKFYGIYDSDSGLTFHESQGPKFIEIAWNDKPKAFRALVANNFIRVTSLPASCDAGRVEEELRVMGARHAECDPVFTRSSEIDLQKPTTSSITRLVKQYVQKTVLGKRKRSLRKLGLKIVKEARR